MTDNLPACFALPEIGLLRLSGPDAAAFAQSQFANDVDKLAVGQWQWSCWLSAKGRVLDVFALARLSDDTLLLILPDGGAQALGQALQRFVFRRKLSLTIDPAAVSGRFAPPAQASGNALAFAADSSIELDWGSAALPRTLCIGSPGLADVDAAAQQQWRQADLRHGLPRLTADQRESWTAQQLGLDRLNGYSVRKGCYPGQEIVARTHFLGKAKRATVLLQGIASSADAGTAVQAGDNTIGQLASVASPYALAVLPLERDATPMQVAGEAVIDSPLLDGLQR